jgi:hypothetical protein
LADYEIRNWNNSSSLSLSPCQTSSDGIDIEIWDKAEKIDTYHLGLTILELITGYLSLKKNKL